jgi:chromosome segregation ATPase
MPSAEPPTLLVTTLRKERDTLQHALDAELAHRRSLETELESLSARFHEQGLEVINLRIQRDRADEETRAERQRLQSEYSSNQSKMGEVESQLRKARFDHEDLRSKHECLEREY